MPTSTLFIGNLTVIDYAYVHPTNLTITGGSLNLSVEVTGNVEPIENVVVDFSTIKKTIKNLIDDKEEGFDHKIWVPEEHGDAKDFEKWLIPGNANFESIVMFPFDYKLNKQRMVVATPKFTLACPRNAIKVCNYNNDMISHSIRDYLEENLNIEYPNSDIKVKAFVTDRPVLPYDNFPGNETSFTYVHGLKNSTSWGCQNIAHGHKSWLLFVNGYGQVIHLPEVFRLKIKDTLDGHMFIWRDNVIGDDGEKLQIGYETFRGNFHLLINKTGIKTHIINTETTVEHLAEWFVSFFEEDVKEMMLLGASRAYFSEGLVKGACINLKERFNASTI